MELEKKMSIVEAVLFSSGDPIDSDRLSISCGIDTATLPKLIDYLRDKYEQTGSALEIIKLNDCYQMVTRQEYAEYIKMAMEIKKPTLLSTAAMEVLTIVAYNQSVTKSFIEHVRGVDSSSVVNSLVDKNLLEEAGRLDVPGKPISYRTTDTFLRCFKLGSIDELPPLPNKDEQMRLDEIQV